MSDGFIIISENQLDFLQRERKRNFRAMSSKQRYRTYIRFDNSVKSATDGNFELPLDWLNLLQDIKAANGESFFSRFRMTNGIGDEAIAERCIHEICKHNYEPFDPLKPHGLKLDVLYRLR